MKLIQRQAGETIQFEIKEDPNPLGMDIPEAIHVLLEQDKDLNDTFSKLTDGKKRSIIVRIRKIKDIDKQISTAIDLIANQDLRR